MHCTDFYNLENEILILGRNIEHLYIYGDGEILADIDRLETYEKCKEFYNSVYDGEIRKVFLSNGLKRANKINLNRSDNFYAKNPNCRYTSIDSPYNLYIHKSECNLIDLGDVIVNRINHEENYKHAFLVTFKKVEFKRRKIERIICDDYTLQDGERFGDGYGTIEHKQVSYFDTSNTLYGKKHPEHNKEKGIIKRWCENEVVENGGYIITSRYYSKCIKDDYRKQLDDLSETLRSININLSFYDLDKLYKNGFRIEKTV